MRWVCAWCESDGEGGECNVQKGEIVQELCSIITHKERLKKVERNLKLIEKLKLMRDFMFIREINVTVWLTIILIKFRK